VSSTGVNNVTGKPLRDFDHVIQSIGVILTTPIGSRVMRREFGSELFDLVDRPMTARVILAVYAAAVLAIARWEPRYAVTGIRLLAADAGGALSIEFNGTYYPNGHLGDFTPAAENLRIIIPIRGTAQ
jgi:phage baseplate assembly protein W